ncbi:MFS transporter, partial [bacterium]
MLFLFITTCATIQPRFPSSKGIQVDVTPIDYSKKWYVMAAVAMGVFLATIDGSIVNIALPTLVKALGEPLAVVEWVVLAYLLTVTTLMISMGRLADMIGKKPLYLIGFAGFTLGSALCGLSTSVGMLIAFRVFQAIGASMMMALGTAIVTEAFPVEERGKALGIVGMMVSIGVIAGPTIGGIILEHMTWNWLFFVNVPVGLIGIPMVLRFVPAIRPKGRQRFDYWGAILLLLGFCA